MGKKGSKSGGEGETPAQAVAVLAPAPAPAPANQSLMENIIVRLIEFEYL